MRLVLASASPRRAEILRNAGIPFEILPTNTDEGQWLGESAVAMVRRLAEAKARAAAAQLRGAEPAIVIGADTVVELAREVLGKPGSPEAARGMLQALSGNTHSVLTGIALIRLPDGAELSAVEVTEVSFSTLTPEEIDEYVATGEPMDKAGAYGVQGFAGRFVERIEGCYFNVVGLPLARLYGLLKELEWSPREGSSQSPRSR